MRPGIWTKWTQWTIWMLPRRVEGEGSVDRHEANADRENGPATGHAAASAGLVTGALGQRTPA